MRRYSVFFIAIPAAAICVRLGLWQVSRLSERRALNAELRANQALQPVSLDRPLPELALDVRTNGRVPGSREGDEMQRSKLWGRKGEGLDRSSRARTGTSKERAGEPMGGKEQPRPCRGRRRGAKMLPFPRDAGADGPRGDE